MSLTLEQVPEGTQVRIVDQGGDKPMARRLLSLGLRVGAQIEVLQQRGQNGVVVASAGTRVALGRDVASRLRVENV